MQSTMAQFQQDTKSSIQNLENQVGQISNALSKLEAKDSGKLPSQTKLNPRQNVNAITLRCGKKLESKSDDGFPLTGLEVAAEEEGEQEKEAQGEGHPTKDVAEESEKPYVWPNFPPLSAYKPVPPFPEALKETRRLESDM